MKKGMIWLIFLAVILAAFGCAVGQNEGSMEANELKRYDNTDFMPGNDKSLIAHNRMSEPIRDTRQAIMALPGVIDTSIITYRGNVIIGVLTENNSDNALVDRRIVEKSSHNHLKQDADTSARSDGHRNLITRTVLQKLQPQSNYRLVFIATLPDDYTRISRLERKAQIKGVSNNEMDRLLNDLGDRIAPFNLYD